MILFILLLALCVCIGLCAIFAAGIGGVVTLIMYGDIIVCVVLIVLILRKLIKK